VPATSACLPRLPFIIFLLRPLTALIKETRQAISAIKHSIFLRCLCYYLILIIMFVVVVIPWVQILLNYDFVKVLVLFGGGLAPTSQTLGFLLRTLGRWSLSEKWIQWTLNLTNLDVTPLYKQLRLYFWLRGGAFSNKVINVLNISN